VRPALVVREVGFAAMTEAATGTHSWAGWLDQSYVEAETLRRFGHIDSALRRARDRLADVGQRERDDRPGERPSALVAASRRPGEPWFCLAQPERDGSALAALGCVQALEASGPDQFAQVARRWRQLVAGALLDAPDGPPGSGLVALGGLAFAPDGGGSPAWDGFAPASLVVRRCRSLAAPGGRASR
jgi:hypothetical protein